MQVECKLVYATRRSQNSMVLKIFFKNMKKMLLIVAVAFAAMSCGNKCCDQKAAQDTVANDTVEEVVEAAEVVEVVAE